jgi:lytic murein transglycosylase
MVILKVSIMARPPLSLMLILCMAIGAGLYGLQNPAAYFPAIAITEAHAQTRQCETGNFDAWLSNVKSEATSMGISQRAINVALSDVTYDPNVISHDRGQKLFKQTFEQFSSRMISSYRLKKGAQLMRQYADLFKAIENKFGVPAPVLIAIWGLETDYGAYVGTFATIRSIATLAYDCRRTDTFRAELFEVLKIVDKENMNPANMRGAWAGEIGQTQFMPSSWNKFAIDFEGKGRRDLVHSVPDVLASTANFLRGYGWQRGAGWEPGQPNFPVIQAWNKSDVYSRTIARFATKLAATH